MNSSTSRQNELNLTQEQIKQQIALLQSKLVPEPEPSTSRPKSPKRKAPEPVTLAPATPSPKKKRKVDQQPTGHPVARPIFQTASKVHGEKPRPETLIKKIAPSKLLSNLASVKSKPEEYEATEPVARSTGFKEAPKAIQAEVEQEYGYRKRDERLALVEDLEPGPYEFTPPLDDPEFEKLEPHSGIAMKSRTVPHEDIEDYLRGRFYLSPSRLYSAIRLNPDKQGYDVPVPGDWVTIAVVAERGPIKFTRPPVKIEAEEGDGEKRQWKGKGKAESASQGEGRGKKFVNIKLIDFGARSGSGSGLGGTSRASTIRGDAFLTLLLFEADAWDVVPQEDGGKPVKVYRGGSKGAFEHLTDMREGDVIALLNPKILKPFQRSGDSPHPVNNILAVTPESASSIIVIGRSRDLGMCTVRKQDGKVCGSWCDKRVSDVCDYHVQSAVQRRRAARPEFSVGTGGMSREATHKRKHDYDPLTKWGLKPEERSATGATYMVSGHVVPGTSSDPRTIYATESIGREGQAKARRKLAGKDADKALMKLLERDKEGMEAVMRAREVAEKGKKERKAEKEKGKEKDKDKGKGKEKEDERRRAKKKSRDDDDDDDTDSGAESRGEKENATRKAGYSAGVIKSLGFDPSMKPGQRKQEVTGVREKLQALEAVRSARKEIALGPKPGPRIRSGVSVPESVLQAARTRPQGDSEDVNLDSSDEEFPETFVRRAAPKPPPAEETMVDLDDRSWSRLQRDW